MSWFVLKEKDLKEIVFLAPFFPTRQHTRWEDILAYSKFTLLSMVVGTFCLISIVGWLLLQVDWKVFFNWDKDGFQYDLLLLAILLLVVWAIIKMLQSSIRTIIYLKRGIPHE